MRALRFHRAGSLDALAIEEIPTPTPAPGTDDVLVQVRAAAINPSDVKNVLGKMAQTTFPRTPGRDFAGVVTEHGRERAVFGSGGCSGFTRDGSHAEFVLVPRAALLPKPTHWSFEQAAAVGVGYLTAWAALVRAAKLQGGETVLITGALGAVGSAAVHLARRLGARVLGGVRERPETPALPVDEWIQTAALPDAARAATPGGHGADVVLDTVGGPLFEPCLNALAHGGRHVAIAAPGDGRVSFNLRDFYHHEGRLLGVDTLALTFAECAAALGEMLPGFEDGSLPPPAHLHSIPLAQGTGAYRLLDSGMAKTKLVLIP